MAARSEAWFCGRSFAEIAGSIPARGMDVCRECCVLSGREGMVVDFVIRMIVVAVTAKS
jgi:hypothetical protein